MHPALMDKLLGLLAGWGPSADQPVAVLDFGCGDGRLLGALAERLHPDSQLTGLDGGAREIARAEQAWPAIRFEHARFVDSFPFGDASFDLLISVDTIECIADRQALLRECARVLKPGGRILVSHWDWDTQVYASENRQIVRKLVAAFSDWQQPWMGASDGQIGRQLWGLFGQSGFFSGEVQAFCLLETEFTPGNYGFQRLHDLADLARQGGIDADEHALILAEMAGRARQKIYFYSLTAYIWYGIKTIGMLN